MTNSTGFQGQRVTVMGLGHFGGGVGAVRWLARQGAKVTVTDLKTAEQLADGLKAISDLVAPAGPVTLALGGHRDEDFTQAALVVASPAVPPDNPYLEKARAARVPVSTELQLFIERLPAGIKTIGVTGSNGKSTTTALIAHLLSYGVGREGFPYRRVWLGGNIGVSLLEELPNMSGEDVVVLELSSFMLEAFEKNGLKWSPNIAVVTNLSPNHLDRHKSMEAYAHAKMGILRYQTKKDFTILNDDDPRTFHWNRRCKGRVVTFTPMHFVLARMFEPQGPIDFAFKDAAPHLKLPGHHNRQNAAAALWAVDTAGRLVNSDIFESIPVAIACATFHGLPHRLEFVGKKAGVKFYNDSKATTPEAAMLALGSFEEGKVVAIVGGYDKGVDLALLAETLAAQCRSVILIGQVAQKLSQLLAAGNGSPKPAIIKADQFEEAVRQAAAAAQKGDVVLLSPGCASYGMFNHYEERGDRFRELVKTL